MTKGTRSIHEYLKEAKSLADDLASIHPPVWLRSSSQTREDYVMFVMSILQLDALPSFSNLRARLLTYEAQCNRFNSAAPAHALMAAQNPPPPQQLLVQHQQQQ